MASALASSGFSCLLFFLLLFTPKLGIDKSLKQVYSEYNVYFDSLKITQIIDDMVYTSRFGKCWLQLVFETSVLVFKVCTFVNF